MPTICLQSHIAHSISYKEDSKINPKILSRSFLPNQVLVHSLSSASITINNRQLVVNALSTRPASYNFFHSETKALLAETKSQLNNAQNVEIVAHVHHHHKAMPAELGSKQSKIAEVICGNGDVFNELNCTLILRECDTPEDLFLGQQAHAFSVKYGACENVVVGTSLICMYSRCGCLIDAEHVFHELPDKDVQCFNTMILEHGKSGYGIKSVESFHILISSGLEPNVYTYTNAISSCGQNMCLAEGKQLHALAMKSGYILETSVGNAVITMYAKHGLVEESGKTFSKMGSTNLISWTALMSGYVQNGYFERAFASFLEMIGLGMYTDGGCWATTLDACSESQNYKLGLQLHGSMVKLGHLSDMHAGTALVDFYAKHKNMIDAKLVFNYISGDKIAPFNAILVGFVKCGGDGEEDLMRLLNQQRFAGMAPDVVTFSSLLSFCAHDARLNGGQALHAYIVKTGFGSEINVGNALITMYAKCGNVGDACKIFHHLKGHDTVSWNSMISAFALSGQGNKALQSFEEMMKQGYVPDEITLLAVLQGCCYSGLLNDGFQLFMKMESKYGVRPVLEHYACMVGLIGRAGLLSEAMDFICRSPFSDCVMLWRTLVNLCKLCGEPSVGKLASRRLLALGPADPGSHILVSNMFAGEGMFDEAAKVRTTMNDLNVNKEVGCSWIEVDNKLHHFIANKKDDPVLLDVLGLG